MSAPTKTLTLSGQNCMAIVRALKMRLDVLASQSEFADTCGDWEMMEACKTLIDSTSAALAIINSTQFDGNRAEGMKP